MDIERSGQGYWCEDPKHMTAPRWTRPGLEPARYRLIFPDRDLWLCATCTRRRYGSELDRLLGAEEAAAKTVRTREWIGGHPVVE